MGRCNIGEVLIMRSDRWDEEEKKKFSGFAPRGDPRFHEHQFNEGKCVYCGKTREQLRKDWQY